MAHKKETKSIIDFLKTKDLYRITNKTRDKVNVIWESPIYNKKTEFYFGITESGWPVTIRSYDIVDSIYVCPKTGEKTSEIFSAYKSPEDLQVLGNSVKENDIVTYYENCYTGDIKVEAKVVGIYKEFLTVVPIGENEPLTLPMKMFQYRGKTVEPEGYLGV